ncbi:probable inactive leucine-rich repeat receptor-like protein kinase at3g03770 [Phtheirospermum japonicum]|uniref:Probable inactive leucine-rich repeat receptor-like protein kinase at3g03770 n=1 Tax=Phtheirospermum japonicum TaxID=374723 RepID=A0A830BB50_9LAMI|nr:probable inactive leucine-rich repeat receptor-like protein kinase at3g03770 [Phtheirospermum japonicum]
MQMQCFANWVLVSCLLLLAPTITHQLNSYQAQVLLQLRKHLEFPSSLDAWGNNSSSNDFCTLSSPPHMTIACENDAVTELRVMGELKPPTKQVRRFTGFPIPNQTLSQSFSIDSFITTLTRLSSLKVLCLVSLGIWGPLPDKIHRLYSLQALDMSSNFLFGSIPPQMSRLVKLQTLTLDENFFNDTVPEWLDSLTNLTTLSLKNNRLKGNVPFSVSRITTLTELILSHNLLSGKLPDLSHLSNLQLLDLSENGFDSELPPLPTGLANIFLSNNSFSGSILPAQFGKLNRLQHLDLSGNYLSGAPPDLLFSLPNIIYLNLSSNALRGSLPAHLNCGGALSLVDLSGNRLTGHLPNCLDAAADSRIVKIGGNCFSVDARNQHSEGYCEDKGGERGSAVKEIAVLGGVIGGIVIVVAILLVIGLLFFCKRQRRTQQTLIQHVVGPKVKQDNAPPSGISSELLANARIISEAAKLGNQSGPPYRVFSVEDLEDATKGFDQSTFLGEGSIGKVYKGRLENGTFVAIRCLALHRKYSIRNLRLRLDLLSKLHHPHLVGLLGHCIDGDDSTIHRLFLVQEFVPNGNFRSHLSETSPEQVLKWSERLSVLIGVAKAVHFLHTGVIPPCFNNRLKTNNILLDEHGIAKLSDYGMSIIADETEISQAKGDAVKSGLNVEKLQDDVYNFGFILLESLVGPTISGKEESFLLVNEMTSSFSSQDGRRKIVDPIVLTSSSQESLSTVISITNKCVSPDSSSRPSFEDVLWNLQYAAQVQATFDDADQKSETGSRQSFG